MTAAQVIAEIQALPPQGKEEVLKFTRRLEAERALSGAELTSLADKLAVASDDREVARLREEITKGFYGGE